MSKENLMIIGAIAEVRYRGVRYGELILCGETADGGRSTVKWFGFFDDL